MAKDPAVYADHILTAIAHIEADIIGLDLARFQTDRRARQLVERNLEILSEASRRLPDHLKAKEPDIPWRDIATLGNVLRHAYHETAPKVLWETCVKDLGPLKAAVERIRREMNG